MTARNYAVAVAIVVIAVAIQCNAVDQQKLTTLEKAKSMMPDMKGMLSKGKKAWKKHVGGGKTAETAIKAFLADVEGEVKAGKLTRVSADKAIAAVHFLIDRTKQSQVDPLWIMQFIKAIWQLPHWEEYVQLTTKHFWERSIEVDPATKRSRIGSRMLWFWSGSGTQMMACKMVDSSPDRNIALEKTFAGRFLNLLADVAQLDWNDPHDAPKLKIYFDLFDKWSKMYGAYLETQFKQAASAKDKLVEVGVFLSVPNKRPCPKGEDLFPKAILCKTEMLEWYKNAKANPTVVFRVHFKLLQGHPMICYREEGLAHMAKADRDAIPAEMITPQGCATLGTRLKAICQSHGDQCPGWCFDGPKESTPKDTVHCSDPKAKGHLHFSCGIVDYPKNGPATQYACSYPDGSYASLPTSPWVHQGLLKLDSLKQIKKA